jgi:hypothetical protein
MSLACREDHEGVFFLSFGQWRCSSHDLMIYNYTLLSVGVSIQSRSRINTPENDRRMRVLGEEKISVISYNSMSRYTGTVALLAHNMAYPAPKCL